MEPLSDLRRTWGCKVLFDELTYRNSNVLRELNGIGVC